MKNWFWILLVLVMAGSCLEEPECTSNADTALVITFTRLADGKPDTVILYRITATGADSIFYKTDPEQPDTLIGSDLLAVNPFAGETLFTFLYETGEKDLKVGYKRETRFISEDCGSEQMLYDLSILESDFDSVQVINNRLTTSRVTNIEIFH